MHKYLLIVLFSISSVNSLAVETSPNEPPFVSEEEWENTDPDTKIQNQESQPNEPPFISENDWEDEDPESELEPKKKTLLHRAKRTKSGKKRYSRIQSKTLKPGERRVKHPLAKHGLIRITKEGKYIYQTEASEMKSSASVKFGSNKYSKLSNASLNGKTFEDIYKTTEIALLFDYEDLFSSSYGFTSIVYGMGLTVANARGYFKNDPETEAQEKYTFFMLPLSVSGVYKFQYSESQWLVPYVNTGLDLFFVAEIRDDSERNKLSYAPGAHGAVGINILLDSITNMVELDSEYGLNHIWFTVEFRQIVGLDKELDLTSSLLSAGVSFDF